MKSNASEKSCKLYIDGMHCASCEVLIEKKLRKQSGVRSANASLADKSVEVTYSGGNKPDIQKLNQEFSELGYKFSYKNFNNNATPAIGIKDGNLVLNSDAVSRYFKTLAIFFGLLLVFFIFNSLHLGKNISVDSSSSLPAFFVLGLVAGVSSCAALVGGLLLSMIKQWNELYIDSNSKFEKAQPHILFHTGRIISFALLGGVLGLLGQSISLDNPTIFAVLTIFVSLIMSLLALQMLGVRWAQGIKLGAPKVLTKFVADESNFQGRYMPFTLGALTFLLPCGFTLLAQTIALASGSFVQGSLIMLLFALGTLPMLVGISLGGLTFNSRPSLTAKFNIVAGLVIIFFAIYNINGQLNVLGYTSLNDISFTKDQGTVQAADDTIEGKQVLNITAEGFSYIPTSSTTLKAGVPTVMIVNNKGIDGCGAFMAARGLFEKYVQLKPGENRIAFTPQKGTYKLTCSMGMVPPVTITVI